MPSAGRIAHVATSQAAGRVQYRKSSLQDRYRSGSMERPQKTVKMNQYSAPSNIPANFWNDNPNKTARMLAKAGPSHFGKFSHCDEAPASDPMVPPPP